MVPGPLTTRALNESLHILTSLLTVWGRPTVKVLQADKSPGLLVAFTSPRRSSTYSMFLAEDQVVSKPNSNKSLYFLNSIDDIDHVFILTPEYFMISLFLRGFSSTHSFSCVFVALGVPLSSKLQPLIFIER